jgi:hypothetical protein
MALVFAPSASAVLASVRSHQTGQASGVNNAIREVGGVFGVAVLSTVFAHTGGFTSPQALVDGTVPAVLTGAGFTFFGAILAMLYRPAPAPVAEIAPAVPEPALAA